MDYFAAGYSPIPLPYKEKWPPPKGGYTGGDNKPITEKRIRQWLADKTPRNIGIVMPDNVVILDVDGAEALQRLIEHLGELPHTWRTTNGDPDRFHLWLEAPRNRTWPGKIVNGVDVIQRHHRYLVAPPSIHPSGAMYHFINPRGKVEFYIPEPYELDFVSERVIRGTRQGAYKPFERADVDSQSWLDEFGGGRICAEMRRVLVRHQKLLRQGAADGGMHDAMTNGVWAVMAEISHGHTGGTKALARLFDTFEKQATESGRRTSRLVKGEWKRAIVGAVEKTAIEQVRLGDPCEIEEAERDLDPDRFFDKKHGLLAQTFQAEIERTGPLAVGPGQVIFRYTNGVWVPDGDSELYRRTESLMGERKRPSQVNTIKAFIQNQSPLITEDSEDTQYLNLPNGLLDWRTGKLYPHNPHIVSTVRIPVEWDEDADCPTIESWLPEVLAEDCIDFAYQILGYMLYNGNPLHKAIILYGTGRNGKGTFLQVARRLVGHNNCAAVTPQALDAERFAPARLYGKLANLVGDVDPRIFKSTEKFKQLTGGDHIDAEHKYGQPFSFQCRALMIAGFNSLPRTADTTDGFFSRWLILPFPNRFDASPDITLPRRLTRPAELQGLLRRAVDGLRMVLDRRELVAPPSVRAATAKFRIEADPLRSYIDERIEGVPRNIVGRQEVYQDYVAWAVNNGFQSMSTTRFYESLTHLLAELIPHETGQIRRNNGRYYRGIRLTHVN
jgi:P4 family phage/plasmid primase-like protien